LSFAIAAHEIGHLVENNKQDNLGLDNFKAVRIEEQRAWDMGWSYLEKHLAEYFENNQEAINKISLAFEKVKFYIMAATDLSESMYCEPGSLDSLSDEEYSEVLKEKREDFYSNKNIEVKKIFDEMKLEKNGVKPDWEKFVGVIRKALLDIIKDNKSNKEVK